MPQDHVDSLADAILQAKKSINYVIFVGILPIWILAVSAKHPIEIET
jgi:hypothetical protein